MEAGIEDIDAKWAASPPGQHTSARKRRRDEGISYVAAAISKMAESSTMPHPIVIQDAGSPAAADPNMLQLERVTKGTSTVTSLIE